MTHQKFQHSTTDILPFDGTQDLKGYDYAANQVPFVSGITDAMFAEMCTNWRKQDVINKAHNARVRAMRAQAGQ